MRTPVIRDGHEQEILARELVPGDVVCLHTFVSRSCGVCFGILTDKVDHHRRRPSGPCRFPGNL
jgi:hypothetical protein